MYKALNAFYCLRCGHDVAGIHPVCHQDWQGFRGTERKAINGGWHDAGDLSQGYFRTAYSVYAMIETLQGLEQDTGYSALAARYREEIKWGLDWLLKTRFGDGFHLSWSTNRIYSDNVIGTLDDVVSQAQNVPWENFLASAVFSKAAMLFRTEDPPLAARAEAAAKDDWHHAHLSRERWDQAEYREASWGATASVLLAKLTGDRAYLEQAATFGHLVLRCQEQRFVAGIPIAGYFYETTARARAVHNFHHSFEESPLVALALLCEAMPEHPDWIQWYSAVAIHSDFFLKRGSLIAAPFRHLPNSVWTKEEILTRQDPPDVRSSMLQQFAEGFPLTEDRVLRTFPIYASRGLHGATMIQMASAWALAESSRLRGDFDGMSLVQKQLEWVMGANTFGQSMMYGVGHNFPPLMAYTLKNIVGSLPVGIDSLSGDQPYWSATNSATSKEIWVEPANRFLMTVHLYRQHGQAAPTPDKGLSLAVAPIDPRSGQQVTVTARVNGLGKGRLELKAANLEPSVRSIEVDLNDGAPPSLSFDFHYKDDGQPFVVVATFRGEKTAIRRDVTGAKVPSTALQQPRPR